MSSRTGVIKPVLHGPKFSQVDQVDDPFPKRMWGSRRKQASACSDGKHGWTVSTALVC